jgi:predicted RNase H-like HicB family nuclease
MKYLVVYERSATGWGAYAPDLPGLGAAGRTLDEVKNLIRQAIEFHLEGMREHGDPIPAPRHCCSESSSGPAIPELG